MARNGKKGLVARWLEGKERSEEYARSTLPTSRWALFWDIFKGRFGKLIITNLLVLVTFLPLIAFIFWRSMSISSQGVTGPYGAGLGIGYPFVPDITGTAEMMVFQADLMFFLLYIPSLIIAGLGISGGMYIIRNMIWTEGIFVANDFVRGIRRNFLSVLEAVLIFSIVLFTARTMGNLADVFVATKAGSAGWLVASKVIGYALVALSIPICLWMISLGVNYKQGPWSLFRNAVVMTIGTFPQSIFFAALSVWPIFFVIFGSGILMIIGIFLLLFIAFAYAMLVWMDFSQWAFDRFINPDKGFTVGKGLYNKDGTSALKKGAADKTGESEAMREYKRMIVAQGKSKLVCRPIKPIDDDLEIYQLPEAFSREDLRRLKESKTAVEEDVKAYEEEHKNDEQYVEYNQRFEEREKALKSPNDGKKKKAPTPPKMLNKVKRRK